MEPDFCFWLLLYLKNSVEMTLAPLSTPTLNGPEIQYR